MQWGGRSAQPVIRCQFVRRETLLAIAALPEAIDDCVGPDNPVRSIEAFVDSLNLEDADFGRRASLV